MVQTTEKSESTPAPAKNIMKPRSFGRQREVSEYEEQVIEVRRVSRTVKGGRRMSFRALVVIGNKKGKVGMGIAKATDVTEAVRKAVTRAKKKLIIVPIISGTIPYEITAKHGSAVVMLRPASEGTSIVAGGAIRTVAELAGITDLLSKIQGSASKVNNVIATLKAFESFKDAYVKKLEKYAEAKNAVAPKAETSNEKVEVKAVKTEAKSEEPAPKKTTAKKVVKK